MRNLYSLTRVASFFAALGICLCSVSFAAGVDSITSPGGGEVYTIGQKALVRVQKATLKKNVLIEISRDGGATFVALGTIPGTLKTAPKEFDLEFDVTGPPTSNAIVRASGAGLKGPVSVLSRPFSITASDLALGIMSGELADKSVTAPKINSESSAAATVLTADGSGGASFLPAADLTLPYVRSKADPAVLFDLTNPGTGAALRGTAPSGMGVRGESTTGIGLFGRSSSGAALSTIGGVQMTGIGQGANKVLTSDANGNATWQNPISIPPVVTFLGAWNAATTYSQSDLVTSSTAGMYFYSLQAAANLNHPPESSPTFWGSATIDQLGTIRKTMTLSAPGFTSLMSVHLTGTNTAGGRIQYTIRATDGGTQVATEEGVMQWLANPNSITCTIQTADKLHLGTVGSVCTPGFFNPAAQPGVSISDTVAFQTPANIVIHEVYFRIVPTVGLNFPSGPTGPAVPSLIRLEP